MICPTCKTVNAATAKFCKGCGHRLVIAAAPVLQAPQERECPSCHTINMSQAKFCRGCGAALGSAPAAAVPAPSLRPVQSPDAVLPASAYAADAERAQTDPSLRAAAVNALQPAAAAVVKPVPSDLAPPESATPRAPEPSPPAALEPTKPQERPRNKKLLMGLALGAVLLLGGAIFYFASAARPQSGKAAEAEQSVVKEPATAPAARDVTNIAAPAPLAPASAAASATVSADTAPIEVTPSPASTPIVAPAPVAEVSKAPVGTARRSAEGATRNKTAERQTELRRQREAEQLKKANRTLDDLLK